MSCDANMIICVNFVFHMYSIFVHLQGLFFNLFIYLFVYLFICLLICLFIFTDFPCLKWTVRKLNDLYQVQNMSSGENRMGESDNVFALNEVYD